MKALKPIVSVLALMSLFAPRLEAQTDGVIQWRGFLTAGLAVTDSEKNYSGLSRKARVAEETWLGLNLSKDLNDHWRVAAQILARAEQADGAAKIDWAFVTYEPNSTLDITAGKQRVPMWMISEYRFVGRAYPWVNPPEEVYGLFDLRYVTGASIGIHVPLGSSQLDIRPYGGDVLIERQPNSPNQESKNRGNNMFGVALEWRWDKLLLRAAVNQASWERGFGETFDYGRRNFRVVAYGLKAELFGLDLLSEYAYTKDLDEAHYDELAGKLDTEAAAHSGEDSAAADALRTQARIYRSRTGGARGAYATVGRQIGDFYPHLTLAAIKRPWASTENRDQESQALGLNYDIDLDSVIKVEAKRVKVPPDGRGNFVQAPEGNEAMIYRLSYSLVF